MKKRLQTQKNTPEAREQKELRKRKAKGEPMPEGVNPVLLSMVDETARVYWLAKMIIDGKSLEAITAEIQALGLSEDSLRKLISNTARAIQEQAAILMTNWGAISITRTEQVIAGLMPKLFDNNGNPNETNINLLRGMIAEQRRIVELFQGSKDKGDTYILNPTIIAGGKLYERGARALDAKYKGLPDPRDDDFAELDDILDGGIEYKPLSRD